MSAARRAQNSGVALASEKSHIAHVFAEMATDGFRPECRYRRRRRNSVCLDEETFRRVMRMEINGKLNFEQFKADIHRTLISKLDLEKLATVQNEQSQDRLLPDWFRRLFSTASCR